MNALDMRKDRFQLYPFYAETSSENRGRSMLRRANTMQREMEEENEHSISDSKNHETSRAIDPLSPAASCSEKKRAMLRRASTVRETMGEKDETGTAVFYSENLKEFVRRFNRSSLQRDQYRRVAQRLIKMYAEQGGIRENSEYGFHSDPHLARRALVKLSRCRDLQIQRNALNVLNKMLTSTFSLKEENGFDLLPFMEKLMKHLRPEQIQGEMIEIQKKRVLSLTLAAQRLLYAYSCGYVNAILHEAGRVNRILYKESSQDPGDFNNILTKRKLAWYILSLKRLNTQGNRELEAILSMAQQCLSRMKSDRPLTEGILKIMGLFLQVVHGLTKEARGRDSSGLRQNCKDLYYQLREISLPKDWFEKVLILQQLQELVRQDPRYFDELREKILLYFNKRDQREVTYKSLQILTKMILKGKEDLPQRALELFSSLTESKKFRKLSRNRILLFECLYTLARKAPQHRDTIEIKWRYEEQREKKKEVKNRIIQLRNQMNWVEKKDLFSPHRDSSSLSSPQVSLIASKA